MILMWGVLGLVNESQAANIYVDQTLSSDCTSGTYSIANRNCNGADGRAYNTIQEAVNAMNGGDDIYIRGGTYYENVNTPTGKDGTAENYSSIQSYLGEWAVIDGGHNQRCTLGRVSESGTYSNTGYWKFEGLEITGGSGIFSGYSIGGGICLGGGPFIIRYNYIHDNVHTGNGGENPGGIRGYRWRDSIIEYNYFYNNGVYGSNDNSADVLIFSDYEWDQIAQSGFNNDSDNILRNEIRYNYFRGSPIGYKHKGSQLFTGRTTTAPFDDTYNTYGDKIHHNIFQDHRLFGLFIDMDFVQAYNNIFDNNQRNSLAINYEPGISALYKVVVYNNLVVNPGDTAIIHFAGRYWASEILESYGWIYNNIIDGWDDGYYWCTQDAISIAPCEDGVDVDISEMYVDQNYLYRPVDGVNDQLINENSNHLTATQWESGGSSHLPRNVYVKASSEGTDPLYQGTSGADKYKTRANHILEGSTTIANGGIGGVHPYLSGVQIPSYIGAVNPNDNAWVDGVLGLATVSNLQNAPSGDPNWIEGANSDTTPPAAPTGLSVQ
jgi:hypothetical protein